MLQILLRLGVKLWVVPVKADVGDFYHMLQLSRLLLNLNSKQSYNIVVQGV